MPNAKRSSTQTMKYSTGSVRKKRKLSHYKSIKEFLNPSKRVTGGSYATNRVPRGKAESACCSNCQMPLSALLLQTPEQHLQECTLIDHRRKEQCPRGNLCTSTVISHYMNFTHQDASTRQEQSASVTQEGEESATHDSDLEVLSIKDVSVTNDKLVGKSVCSLDTPSVKSLGSCSIDDIDSQPMTHPKPDKQKPVFQSTITSFFSNTTIDSGAAKHKIVLLKPEDIASSPKKSRSSKMRPDVLTRVSPSKGKRIESREFCVAPASSEPRDKKPATKRIKSNKSNKVEESTDWFASQPDCSNRSSASNMQCVPKRRPSKKECPFYKRIPGTSFVVDAFSYGDIPRVTCYFLSHFHYDHDGGLTKNFLHRIYCSEVTGNLVRLKLGVQENYIHRLPLNESVVIEGVDVILLEANHCPGSVMFLFTLPDGREILHTGDFRAGADMERDPYLKSARIDQLYLDTTYCDPRYTFPSQEAVLAYVTSVVVEKALKNQNVLVVCGSYTIGKEKVFQAIADVLDCKIWASAEKQRVLRCLNNKTISDRLTSKQDAARVHVLSMMNLGFKFLNEHLSKSACFNEIVAFKPTGWEYRSRVTDATLHKIKPVVRGAVSIYGVPYSEHSSFVELKRFVQFIRPKKVIPTVGMGERDARSAINSIISDWLQ